MLALGLGDALGLALGLALGVSLGLALGVSLGLAETVGPASVVEVCPPKPREKSRVSSTTTAMSRSPPMIERTMRRVFDLVATSGSLESFGATNRSVGVSSLMIPRVVGVARHVT